MKLSTLILVIASILLTSGRSEAIWPIFHQPAFNGRILDIETRRPIEGAVVVVIYNQRLLGSGKGESSSIINVKEALTDKDGKFHIPAYTTVLATLFTKQDSTTFLIYKPGYASVTLGLKMHFSGGGVADREIAPWDDPVLSGKYRIRLRTPGIVELPRLQTKDERLRSMPELPDKLDHLARQKELIRLINEERKDLGEPEMDPYRERRVLLKAVKGQK